MSVLVVVALCACSLLAGIGGTMFVLCGPRRRTSPLPRVTSSRLALVHLSGGQTVQGMVGEDGGGWLVVQDAVVGDHKFAGQLVLRLGSVESVQLMTETGR